MHGPYYGPDYSPSYGPGMATGKLIYSSENGAKKINKNKFIKDIYLAEIKKEFFITKKRNKFFICKSNLVKYFFILIVLLFFILLSFFIISHSIFIKINNIDFILKDKNPKKEDIYRNYTFDSLQESFNKAKNFLDKCSKGILLNDKSKFKESNHPLISVIVPAYNSQNFINRAIKSIQNQNITDIEIILVDDVSTDNTLTIIEELQKQDPRIKILKNNKNMGILYSRTVGALSSKGKFIFSLDNDDMFLDFDVFSTITNIANEGNFDVVEFRGAKTNGLNVYNIIETEVSDIYFTQKETNLVLFQPELGDYMLKPKEDNDDYIKYEITVVFFWTKCIKGNIYKKALNKLGKEKYSRYMTLHEDAVGTFAVLSIANSYKYVGKYGIYNIIRYRSGARINNNIQNCLKEIYLVDAVIDFAKNTTNYQKLIPNLIFTILNIYNLENVINIDNNYRKLVYSCLIRALKLNFLSKCYKKKIIDKIKHLKYINYSIIVNNGHFSNSI